MPQDVISDCDAGERRIAGVRHHIGEDRRITLEGSRRTALDHVDRGERVWREEEVDGGRDIAIAAIVVWQRAGRHAEVGTIGFAKIAPFDGKGHKL